MSLMAPPGMTISSSSNAGYRRARMNESSVERTFVYAGDLADGTTLFKTEDGSLLTEEMLTNQLLTLCEKSILKISPYNKQRMRIVIELSEVKEDASSK